MLQGYTVMAIQIVSLDEIKIKRHTQTIDCLFIVLLFVRRFIYFHHQTHVTEWPRQLPLNELNPIFMIVDCRFFTTDNAIIPITKYCS